MKQFCDELAAFNLIHRLIGNVSCETLLKESQQAIANSHSMINEYKTMIDIGAGCGVLGYAWLSGTLDRQIVLVEPDRKAAAFLVGFFAGNPRAKVIQSRIENLRASHLDKVEFNTKNIFAASRAFSGSQSLKSAYLRLPVTGILLLCL